VQQRGWKRGSFGLRRDAGEVGGESEACIPGRVLAE
jgi:hypothetical protein